MIENSPTLAEQEQERRRLTLEALADVDAGNVIDHQAVQAWSDSLGNDKPLPAPGRKVGDRPDETGEEVATE